MYKAVSDNLLNFPRERQSVVETFVEKKIIEAYCVVIFSAIYVITMTRTRSTDRHFFMMSH